MENKILIDVERFEELIRTQQEHNLLLDVVFSEEHARLNYDKTAVYFEPCTEVLKLLHPHAYNQILEKLKECENV